jgi:hypothetical protein
VLPLPDRNRRIPVRNIPFPISRNTGFVFPSGLPVPVPVPGQKIQEQEWLRHFPDRSRPFSSLHKTEKFKDMQETLDYFRSLKEEDPDFFYKIKLDENHKVENLFWVDSAARRA